MSKQTAIQLLRESINSEMKSGTKMVVNWDMYLELERIQIAAAYNSGCEERHNEPVNGKQYYKEMYTSNASELGNSLEWNGEVTKGNNHIVDTNEMIDHIGDANKMVKEDSLHFPTSDVNQVPDVRKMVEISDEEIEDVAWEKFITNSGRFGFIAGAQWYREQLKK